MAEEADGDRSGGGLVAAAHHPRGWKRLARPAVLLLVGGVAIYLLLPSLLAVFGSWHTLRGLDWRFAALALVCELASFTCRWELDRIALGTRDRFTVVTAQLTGNALGRVLPGGGATAIAVETSMLGRAGVSAKTAVAGLGASTVLQIATVLSLPVLALPAVLGGTSIPHGLETASYLGAAALVLLIALGVLVFTTDAPLKLVGRVTQWILNSTVRRNRPLARLDRELLAVRDDVRGVLGRRWRAALLAAAGKTGFDYLALLASLRAVGAEPDPPLVLLAYAAAAVLTLVPATPGGLGFVEAGLLGMLTLAGVPAGDALTATLLYRIVSFWAPLPAGAVAYMLFRRRYGDEHAAGVPRPPAPSQSSGGVSEESPPAEGKSR
jgi:hypothetical protein